MVLNHLLPLCANTFVLLRDSARRVMSIHNVRSETMNVKSSVYTTIVHARMLPNIIFHLGPSTERLLAKPRTNREEGQKRQSCRYCHGFFSSMKYSRCGRCDSNCYEMSSKKRPRMPRWGIRESEKIFEFYPNKGVGGREGPLIPEGKSYIRCSNKSPSDKREKNVQGM